MLGIYMYIITIFLGLFISTALSASTVTIPLDDNNLDRKPPEDLVYKNNRIDTYQALQLKRNGHDLSKLNPYESNLWQDKKHSLKQSTITDKSFNFLSYKASPTEIFRAIITTKDSKSNYTVTASLDNHTNIIRANILRLLGYDVATPLFFKNLKINFDSEKARDEFIDKMGEQTLTKRTKWVSEKPSSTSLIIKDVTLEPAKLDNVNLYLPVMTRARQENRRIFRSVLALYLITDFPQSINAINWKVGRVFNQVLSINHPYASHFMDVSKEDLKWFVQRLNRLSEQEIRLAISKAGYPQEITELVFQKIKSRINSLSKHLSLKQKFSVNRMLSGKNLRKGQLQSNLYEDHVVEFYKEDEESPYRFRELFRLFRTQLVYNSLSTVLNESIEKFVPGLRVDDATRNVQEQIQSFRSENPSTDGVLPLGIFSYPTAYVTANANRNVVFGQHLGSFAPIQLVDSVSAEANLGLFNQITGLDDQILPSINFNASMGRSYSHVRAMPDLSTATSQKVKKLLIPKLLKSLGHVINDEFKCTLEENIVVEEEEFNGQIITYIKYDKNNSGAKAEAIAKREELISSGVDEGTILLKPVDKTEECETQIEDLKQTNMDKFLKEFALNETFIITDTIMLSARAQANIPLPSPTSTPLSSNLSSDYVKGILQSILIRKKAEGFEVNIQRQDNINKSLGMGIQYFIEVLNGSKTFLTGNKDSEVYFIKTEGLDKTEKEIALKTLRELFISGSQFNLESNYKPILVDQEVHASLNQFKFLWLRTDIVNLDNYVEIILPQQDNETFSAKERTKNLFSTAQMKRDGKSLYTLINTTLSRISRFINLGSNSADYGQTIKGSSTARYYISEADITAGIKNIITTKIDFVWKGWSTSFAQLDNIFNQVEAMFPTDQENYLINRESFRSNGLIKGYEVRTTIIVYPKAVQKFLDMILNTSTPEAILVLKNLYGIKKLKRHCLGNPPGPIRLQRPGNPDCVPRVIKNLIALKNKKLPQNSVEKVKLYNFIIASLFEHFQKDKVIKLLGSENLFSSTRLTGFQENSEFGYIDYISNSYGLYDEELKTGVFDYISSLLGIAPYELRALNYTPGF